MTLDTLMELANSRPGRLENVIIIKAGILVTNSLNNRMKKNQKLISLVFIRILQTSIEETEENKSEQTFERPCRRLKITLPFLFTFRKYDL